MVNGIINIYKEKGYTSHDVVAKMRGILKMKKIGHTGTLDPEAEGVLPVCMGKATKLVDLITDKAKTYEAVLKLGIVTDTQDLTGQILKTSEVTVGISEIMEAIHGYIGEYDQLPPMYSAIKVNGQRLYELARQGKEIERN
ncbi:MAG TPA: tRNA pseudouridine(55) synthase TruB, partial [Mobilitalea sp.]|nr:tRNA pseudouridine(55) synthase TruB [Mobilitalea sp.]